jgi:hypothetical protein
MKTKTKTKTKTEIAGVPNPQDRKLEHRYILYRGEVSSIPAAFGSDDDLPPVSHSGLIDPRFFRGSDTVLTT